jgi:hypothetical protein
MAPVNRERGSKPRTSQRTYLEDARGSLEGLLAPGLPSRTYDGNDHWGVLMAVPGKEVV